MPARWGTVAAYAAVAAANQLLWLTYAPITTDVARHFDVSEGAVGWLSQVFPLLYVVLAIPAGLALDRRFRSALLTGAWLTALGGAVRLGWDTFAAALAGQILIAIAQPLILNAVTKVAVTSLPEAKRAQGISLGSAGIFAGTALALPLGPLLGDAESLIPLLVVDLVVAAAAAAAWPARCARARGGPTRRDASAGVAGGRAAGRLARPGDPAARRRRVPGLRRLRRADHVAAGAARARGGLGRDRGLAPGRDGARGGRRLGRPARAARPARRRSARSCASRRSWRRPAALLLAIAPGAAVVAVVPLGVVLLGSLPVILELTERRSETSAATALIWLAGNAGGIVVAVLVQATQDHPARLSRCLRRPPRSC